MHRTPSIELLAWAIERDGIGRHEADVAAVLNRLDRRGAGVDTLVGIVADPSQPAVARERAFGRLVVDTASPRLAVLAAVTAARPVPRAA